MKACYTTLGFVLSMVERVAAFLRLKRARLVMARDKQDTVRIKKCVLTVCGIMLLGLSSYVFAAFFYDPITDDWYYLYRHNDGSIREIPVASVDFRVDIGLKALDFGLSGYSDAKSSTKPSQGRKASPLTQIPKSIYHNAYQIDTSSFTTDEGEPLVTGMTRTFGRFYQASRNERVVLNTYGSTRFGSELDTIIAVYRIDFSNSATGAEALKRVAVNDDKNIPGFTGASLVQFDARKGEYYAIQVGSKNDGGDVLLTGFTFPLQGGLTIQPLNAYDGYSYSCNIVSGYDGYTCPNVDYIVYNSTDKTLTVTGSTGLTNGFTPPKPFTLAPGAAVVKTFVYNPALVNKEMQTLSGGFSFTGKAGAKVVAKITMPARVTLHVSYGENPTLKLTATPKVLAGTTGDVFTFPVTIKNVGTVPAIGCYATYGNTETTLQTAWAAYDLKTQEIIGEVNTPFDIGVGKSATILVAMRSFTDRLADPASQFPIEIGCASGGDTFFNPGTFDLTNNVDFTNTISQYPKLTLLKTTPQNSVLNVSAPGSVFTATFRNGSADTADVTAVVDEQAFNSQTGQIEAFGVAVCSVDTQDTDCLTATDKQLPLSIKPGKTATVKVAVHYPTESFDFSPNKGVSLLLKHSYDTGSFVFDGFIPLAGMTKALNRKN